MDGHYAEMPAQRIAITGAPRSHGRPDGRPVNVNPNGAQNRAVPGTPVPGGQRMPAERTGNMPDRNTVRPAGTPDMPRVRPVDAGMPVQNRQPRKPTEAPVPGNAAGARLQSVPARNRVNETEQPRRPVPAKKPIQKPAAKKPPEKARLGKTRVTDIPSLTQSGNVPKEKAKKKKAPRTYVPVERTVSDEGGNTVVSVVKAVIYMIFVVVVSVFLALAIILVGNDVFAFVKSDAEINVTIPENADFEDITEILYENNIITYPEVFKLYGKLKKEGGPYVAGDFLVSPMTNYGDLMDAFKPKPKSGTSRITIPEGYTTDEIIDLMVSYGIGTREGYEEAIQNYDFDYWFLDELENEGISEDRIYRLDGYLFPDTYDFYNSSSEVTVLNKLLRRFDQLFTDEYREQCDVMGYSVDDIITLASLIEKEAGTAAEFFNVSSVFHNRLNNIAYFPCLDSDATIAYAVHHETGERPKKVDTSYETPYNTYFYKGLPPGPIANPSASAILAALSPAQTKYFYFVSDGNITYFSETKDQHDQYIADIVAKNQ